MISFRVFSNSWAIVTQYLKRGPNTSNFLGRNNKDDTFLSMMLRKHLEKHPLHHLKVGQCLFINDN